MDDIDAATLADADNDEAASDAREAERDRKADAAHDARVEDGQTAWGWAGRWKR